MAEFVAAWDETTDGAAPDYYGILGWTFARAVHQVLEEAVARGDLDRDGIKAAMDGIDELQFGGLTGDYGYGPAAERVPPRTASMFRVDPAAPWGLELVERDVESPVAETLEL